MRSQKTRGVALVTVLAMVVIVSLILVAFVTAMRLDRAAAFTYSQSLSAEQIGRGALNLVVGELRNEMSKDAVADLTYPLKPLFTNVVSTNMMPQGVGTNAVMPNLLKISTAAPPYVGSLHSGSLLASSVSSTAPSQNRRYIDTHRWNMPRLGEFPDNASTPNWVILTRSGATNAVGLGFGATGNTLNNPASSNPNFAVGRFAYAIYDVGGLLDITAAGYPSSLTPTQIQQIKGTLAGALVNEANFQVDQNELINWRNPASESSFVSYVTNFVATNAPGSVYPGDNTFLSRQDLIKTAQAGMAGISTNALPNLTTFSRDRNAPSWGPTYDAATLGGTNVAAYTYKSNATKSTASPFTVANPNPNPLVLAARFPSAATVTSYRNNGVLYTYDVEAGDSLIQRRFSLGRLAWIGADGPQNGGTTQSIQACFGLIWGPSDDPALAGANVWKYVGPTGTAEQSVIKTLSEIASETVKREPNFFELLQAGVLRGSLGVAGSTTMTTFPSTHQAFPMLQVLRIGAAMIDQADTDSYPTVLEYAQSGAAWQAVGTEDLPAISLITSAVGAYAAQTQGEKSATSAVYIMLNLWNPNWQPSGSSVRPRIRVRLKGSFAASNFHGAASLPNQSVTGNGGGVPGYTVSIDDSIELSATSGFGANGFTNSTVLTKDDVVAGAFGAMNDAAPAYAASPAGRWVSTYPLGVNMRSDMIGYRLPDFPFELGADSKTTPTAYSSFRTVFGVDLLDPFNAIMEFQSPSGVWLPYQFANGVNDPLTWVRDMLIFIANNVSTPDDGSGSAKFANYVAPLEIQPGETPGKAFYIGGTGPKHPTKPGTGPVYVQPSWDLSGLFIKSDPRALRFSLGFFTRPELAGSNVLRATLAEDSTLWTVANGSTYVGGLGGTGAGNQMQQIPTIFGSKFYPAQLARNNNSDITGNSFNTQASSSSYVDRDGLRRLGDSGLFSDIDPATGNPYQRTADKPVVLNRPFRSVGELGYVFRDSPWRSLDLFSSKSADSSLIDLFTISDSSTDLVSGRINLNAKNPVVISALIDGTLASVVDGSSVGKPGDIANALVAFTSTNALVNKSQLVNSFGASLAASYFSNVDEASVKERREGFVRALSDVGQTRTWNFLIDVIAQAGRYPTSATGLSEFAVEGERRYWLSIAIDRFTGDIVDQKLELVTE